MKKTLSLLLSTVLLFCIALVHVSAEEPYTIDSTVLSPGATYTGDKDIAFEMDGDSLHFYIEVGYPEMTSTIPDLLNVRNGYCTSDAFANWFNKANFSSRGKVYLNGEPLPTWLPTMDDSAVYYKTNSPTINPAPDGYFMAQGYELIIKPGVEVTEDFFSNNQLVFECYKKNTTEPLSTLTVGTYKEPTPATEMTCELTSSAGTELKEKENTTLTAEVTNGTGDYEYKFIVYNKTTNQWYKLRDFAPENTFDWYTGPGGEKTLFVDVKDANGEVNRFQLDVTVAESDLAVTSFTISPEGVLPTKSQATLTATAENGTTPYEYKFIVYNETSQQWYKLRDFAAENTFDWYTGPKGSKKLYVDVKDADGTVVRKELTVTVSEAADA